MSDSKKNIIMKLKITLSVLLLYSCFLFGQENEDVEVFKTDSTWIKEIIAFPIGFAQDIKYEGFEDLRFPQGWSKEGSPNFWSYVWAWRIKKNKAVTISDLEKNIQLYFDGLLGLDFYNIDGKQVRKTNALFLRKDDNHYIGKVKTFDTRYTKKPMTLNVLVAVNYCEQEKITIIHFKFSPKPLDHAVWDKLDEVTLIKNICIN